MQIKQWYVTTVGLIAAAIIGLIGGVAVPMALSTRSIVDQIGEHHRAIEDRFAAQRFIRNSTAELRAIEDRARTLSTVAVKENHELDFVTAIEAAAQASGIEPEIFLDTANQKTLSPWEREVPVRIQAEGTYPAALAFLRAIERLPYLVTVDAVRFASPRGNADDADGTVEATFSGSVYWIAATAPAFTAAP